MFRRAVKNFDPMGGVIRENPDRPETIDVP